MNFRHFVNPNVSTPNIYAQIWYAQHQNVCVGISQFNFWSSPISHSHLLFPKNADCTPTFQKFMRACKYEVNFIWLKNSHNWLPKTLSLPFGTWLGPFLLFFCSKCKYGCWEGLGNFFFNCFHIFEWKSILKNQRFLNFWYKNPKKKRGFLHEKNAYITLIFLCHTFFTDFTQEGN